MVLPYNYRKFGPAACFAIALLCLVGCGSGRPSTIPVEGTVTFNQKPVADAQVLFTPASGGRPASGETDEEGHFTLTTFEPDDGALSGMHEVSVLKVRDVGEVPQSTVETTMPMNGTSQGLQYLLPVKYASGKTSGLSVDVSADMEPVTLDLRSP